MCSGPTWCVAGPGWTVTVVGAFCVGSVVWGTAFDSVCIVIAPMTS